MTNEAKVIGMSMMFLIGLNLLVVPMVGGEGGLDLQDLSPPDIDISLEEQDTSDGALANIAGAIVGFFNAMINFFAIIIWLISTVSSLIITGTFSVHPILTLINSVVTLVVVVAIVKIIPTT